jgi:hypothetical protein
VVRGSASRRRLRRLRDQGGSAGLLSALQGRRTNTCSIRCAWVDWVGYGFR